MKETEGKRGELKKGKGVDMEPKGHLNPSIQPTSTKAICSYLREWKEIAIGLEDPEGQGRWQKWGSKYDRNRWKLLKVKRKGVTGELMRSQISQGTSYNNIGNAPLQDAWLASCGGVLAAGTNSIACLPSYFAIWLCYFPVWMNKNCGGTVSPTLWKELKTRCMCKSMSEESDPSSIDKFSGFEED